MSGGSVKFGSSSRLMALIGTLAGAAIAIGIPYFTLVHGQHLSGAAQVFLIVLAIVGGGVVACVSAFFGIVIPLEVSGDGPAEMGVTFERGPKDKSHHRNHVPKSCCIRISKDGDKESVIIEADSVEVSEDSQPKPDDSE